MSVFAAVPSAAWGVFCLFQLPVLGILAATLVNLAGMRWEAGNLPDLETDNHASSSSFISLGNSPKKHIIAFMLNSRLPPTKDGLKTPKTP